jgi:hypothetical protein
MMESLRSAGPLGREARMDEVSDEERIAMARELASPPSARTMDDFDDGIAAHWFATNHASVVLDALVLERRKRLALEAISREQPNSECTRDPIYLLQTRHVIPTNTDHYQWDADTETLCDDDGTLVTDEILLDRDHARVIWDTERVFFTRNECELWAKSHAYRWPDGWRSYSVPCEGELAALLRARTTRPSL